MTDGGHADASAAVATPAIRFTALYSSIGRSLDTFCAIDSQRRSVCWNDDHWSNRVSAPAISAQRAAVEFTGGRPIAVTSASIEFVSWHLGQSPGDVDSPTMSAQQLGLGDVIGAFEADASVLAWATDGRWALVNLGWRFTNDSLPRARRARGAARLWPGSSRLRVRAMAMSANDVCAIEGDDLNCWPRTDPNDLFPGRLSRRVHALRLPAPPQQLAASDSTFCARTTRGVFCWGDGRAGTLGNGACSSSTVPVEVRGLPSGIVDVVGRRGYFCAIDGQQRAWCWGSLGCSTDPRRSGCRVSAATPMHDDRLGSARSIAIGCFTTCALQSDGSIRCAVGYVPRSRFEQASEVLVIRPP
ncbi:MAG: hypothetical protein JNK05_20540 [Myxococcales bacterium]|nr:hypothetical protein [Myxococcales bacterium]